MRTKVKAKLLMVVGTASGSGKSTLTMALCNLLRKSGFTVSPFKAINISLNSVVTTEGSEISRAQWLQAIACGKAPNSEINPYLIKYEGKGRAQLIENGKSLGSMTHNDLSHYMEINAKNNIRSAINHLRDSNQIVIIEGSGSPAEINRSGEDYANTFILREYSPATILITDIEQGGAFASLYGTYLLMENRKMLKWFVVNRMRGNPDVLNTGIEKLAELTGIPTLGVIPRIEEIMLPGEDGNDYSNSRIFGTDVCIIRYPMMENLSEVDPLTAFGIGYNYVNRNNRNLLKLAKAIILPGSKDVFFDLQYLRDNGIDEILRERAAAGVKILGICGGYQMLSSIIENSQRKDEPKKVSGIGLLRVDFSYFPEKTLKRTNFTIYESNRDTKSQGYEIHFGNVIKNYERPLFRTEDGSEGSINESGNVFGTNIHGCMESAAFIEYLLNIHIDETYGEKLNKEINRISEIIGNSIDLKTLISYLS